MKKLLCVLLVLLMLGGCRPMQKTETVPQSYDYIIGVWLSYNELDQMLNKDFKAEFMSAVNNCKTRNITDMFVHVRPYCDAIYRSRLFPMREGAEKYDFDILKYMIEICHKNDIKIHAWVNPYRVRTADSELAKLPADSPVINLLSDDDIAVENGIYLDPASSKVRRLIVDGIREIIDNYDVDGIHFDDYFYPTVSDSFDSVSYSRYCEAAQTPLSLYEWRRANVNTLIGNVYTAVKFKDKDIVFSVSPSASIEDNYNKHYADIAAWLNSGCVDSIIPQLYFGFEYPDPNFRFEKLLADWQGVVKNTGTKLLIGLASYKINTDSQPDRAEWANGAEVIGRQIKICEQNENVRGHIFFSYSSMIKYK